MKKLFKSNKQKKPNNQQKQIGYSYFEIPIFPINFFGFLVHRFLLRRYAEIKPTIPRPILKVNKTNLAFLFSVFMGKITAAPNQPADKLIRKSANIPKIILSIFLSIHLSQSGFIKFTKKALASYLIVSIVALSSVLIYLFSPSWFGKEAEAAWVDEDWGFRQEVPVTSTNGSAQSNVFISFTLDTATLITAGKLQSSCQDIRITTQAGEILPYHIGRTNACNNAATTIDFLLTSFPDLKSTYYVYYGNPSAVSADAGAFSQSQASNYTVGSLGTEAKAPGPILGLKFDEGQGTTANDSTTNNLDGTLNGTTWQSEDMCVSGKCLSFDGSDDYVYLAEPSNDLTDISTGSVFAWVRAISPGSSYRGLVVKNSAYGIFLIDGVLALYDWTADTSRSTGVNLADGKWHHVGFTFTSGSANGTKVFIDGQLRLTTTITVLNQNDGLIVGDGANPGTGSTQDFAGFMDQVKVYNYVRSEAEVKADFNAFSKDGASSKIAQTPNNNFGPLNSGLLGYWKLDESSWTVDCSTYNITDYSGSGNNARSCPATTGPAGGAVGKFGNGGDFDGSNDYLNVGNSNGLSLTSAFTLSAWINPDTITGGLRPLIIREQNTNTITYLLYIDTTSGQLGLNIKNGSSNNTALLSTNNLTASTWNHVVGIYDGSNMKVYINGVLENTTTITYSPPSTTGGPQTEFGDSSADSFWGQYDGKMDEVRIYNRALNNAEVSQLYNFAPGPVGYWRFDEGTGTTSADSSGLDNAGTLTNSPTWTTGKFGKGLNFAGSNAHVTRADDADFDFGTAASFTLEGYFKHASTPATVERILTKYDATSGNGGFAVQIETDGDITCGIDDDEASFPEDSVVSTAATYDDDLWHHFSCVKDGTSSLTLYIDGVSVGTPDTSISSTGDFANADPLYIGIAEDGTSNDYLGSLDEIRIYNYARSQKQVVESANAGHPAPGSPVGSAVAYWKFDEGYSTTANDSNASTGGAENLTLNSASWTSAGKFGKAWNGTGGDIRMSIATDSDLEFAAAESFSLSGWFKTDSATNPSAGIEYLISNTTANTDVGFSVYANTDGTICFGIDDDATWGPDVASCSTGDFYDATWHYFSAVRDVTADTTRLYIDAISRDSDTDSTTGTLDGDNTFFVGDIDTDNAAAGQEEFAGDIDELKVYRSALTASQVAMDMNRGQAQVLGALGDNSGSQIRSASQEYCVPGSSDTCTAPVGRWDLNEGSGTTVFDTSGGGFNGSFSGASYTPAKISKGLDFNGSSSTMTTPDLGTISAFTIEFWVRNDALTGAVQMVMEDSAAISSPSFESFANSTTFNFWINNTDSLSTTLPVGEWHHITLTYSDAANTMALCKDGVCTSQTTTQTDSLDNSLYWGYRGSNSSLYSNITLDNIRIYNYIRTASQIAYDYNQGEPVAHWRIDECSGTTINDSSGNSYTGTLTVGASGTQTSAGTCTTSSTAWGNGVTGKRNYSVNFDGTDDYVQVTDTANLRFDANTEDFSLFAWVKRTTTGTEYIISKEDADDDGYRLQFNSSNQVLCSEDTTDVTSTLTITDTNWHHVGCTIDRDGNGQIYIDGKADGTAVAMGTDAMATTSNIRIGTRSYTSTSYIAGQIDDARVYNYALTAKQVQQLYVGGSNRYGPTTGAP